MYFNIQVTRKNGVIANQIFSFADLKSAKANHYYFLASASSDTDIDYVLAEIVDSDGIAVCRELYKEEANERKSQ